MSANHPLTGYGQRRVLIALGSEGRGDDGVGLWIARQLIGKINDCRIISGQDDCMGILNAWEGAAFSVVLDAANSEAEPGTIHRLELDARPLPRELARCSSHGTGLAEAIELARILGRLPERLVIYAIEAQSFKPGDEMTPVVQQAARDLVSRIQQELCNLESSLDSSLDNAFPDYS